MTTDPFHPFNDILAEAIEEENLSEASVDTQKWSQAFIKAHNDLVNASLVDEKEYKLIKATWEKFWKDFLKGHSSTVAKRVFRTFQVLRADYNAKTWENIMGIELDKRG